MVDMLKPMKISIVIPVFNSHKVVRRQLKYFKRLKLPDNIEIILMDDGSDPPLKFYTQGIKNCRIYPTGDTRLWTQGCAKNLGAKIAEGEYLLFTDIDHILPRKAIDAVYNFTGDKMGFVREFAILSSNGRIVQTLDALVKYGFNKKRYNRNKFRVYRHTNTFAMKRKIFWEMGGYAENRCDLGQHPTHDDLDLNARYKIHRKKKGYAPTVPGPTVYVFPAVVRNYKNLFHNLNRKLKVKHKEKSEFEVASVIDSLNHLIYMLKNHQKVFYVRFGDGDFRLMGNRDDSRHVASPELKKELIESLSIKDDRFIKSATLGFPFEPGMSTKVFKPASIEGGAHLKTLQKRALNVTNERYFYNPIVFHYLSLYNPKPLIDFIDTYIKPKIKMFIGGNDRTAMEQFYGKIDYYIQTPTRQAYYSIDSWWIEVEKHAKDCEVILPAVGCASRAIQKRLWNLNINTHCIDIGSINDVLEDRETRGWMRRYGLENIKKNLIGGNLV